MRRYHDLSELRRAQATRHYKISVNVEVQRRTCADCARELGYEQMFEMPFSSFASGWIPC